MRTQEEMLAYANSDYVRHTWRTLRYLDDNHSVLDSELDRTLTDSGWEYLQKELFNPNLNDEERKAVRYVYDVHMRREGKA